MQQWKLGFELIGLGGKSDWAFFFPVKKVCSLLNFFFFFSSGSVNRLKMSFIRVIFGNKGR